jgi:hypothetical protein
MNQTNDSWTEYMMPQSPHELQQKKLDRWPDFHLPYSGIRSESFLGMTSCLVHQGFMEFPTSLVPKEDIRSQVFEELDDVLVDYPTKDSFDSSQLEPTPLNEDRMRIISPQPPNHREQSRFAALDTLNHTEDTLNHVLNPANNPLIRDHTSYVSQLDQLPQEPGLIHMAQSDYILTATSTTNHVKRGRGSELLCKSKEQQQEQPMNKRQRVEAENDSEQRFLHSHAEQWSDKFSELCQFKKENGHCCVPRTFKENVALGRWVKRQRHQNKLKQEGRPSTMTDERVLALERIGFVWDPHLTSWEDRLGELKEYRQVNGHCNVPSNHQLNPRLAAWVKSQRRQYKLSLSGEPSNIMLGRILDLESLGFRWNWHRSSQSD